MYEKKSISGPWPNMDGCGIVSRADTALAKTPMAVSLGGMLECPGLISTDNSNVAYPFSVTPILEIKQLKLTRIMILFVY